MYEDIMRRRRGLGDVVVSSDEDVVIADSRASNDMMQDAFAGVKQLFEAVGGGPYPYVRIKEVGPVRFGDVVVPHNEGIVVNDEASEGYDMLQTEFADDMIVSGDEGIGFAQARRLKQKLRRNRRRITPQGFVYAVEGGSPYQFGDLGKLRISFKHPFGKKSLFGKATRLVGKVAPYAVGGIVGGALLKKGLPALFRTAKGLFKGGGGGEQPQPVEVVTPTPVGVPTPAPTGATDATGAPLPPSIAQATTSAVSPIPQSTAPTASEEVAAATQDAETANTMEAGVAGGFTMPNFSDPKVLLTLGAVGFLIFSQMGKGKSRSRRR